MCDCVWFCMILSLLCFSLLCLCLIVFFLSFFALLVSDLFFDMLFRVFHLTVLIMLQFKVLKRSHSHNPLKLLSKSST